MHMFWTVYYFKMLIVGAVVEGTIVTMLLAQLLAQDPLSGGAGWVGAGLLGLVLGWLMLKHLPAKDAQIMAMIKSRDDHEAALTQTFVGSINVARDEAKKDRDQYRQDMASERAQLIQELAQQRLQKHDLANRFMITMELWRVTLEKHVPGVDLHPVSTHLTSESSVVRSSPTQSTNKDNE